MNLFDIFRRREHVRGIVQPAQVEAPSVPQSTAPQVKSANWQANIVRPYGRTSLLIPTWTRCVTLIMQTMGQMLIQYQRKNPGGGNFVEDTYGANGRLNYLLQVRPNPLMTASQMQEQIEYRKIYYGNAYVFIERDITGYPSALWLCTGGNYNYMTDSYEGLTYSSDRGPRLLPKASPGDVLHFRNTFLTDDMYMGIPTIDYAFKTLTLAATGDEQSLQDVASGGRYKILIQEEKSPTLGTRGRANRKELEKMKDEFAEELRKGSDVLMLDNMADAKVISQTAKDLQLLESRGYSDEAICRLMGVPKIIAIVGDGGGNYRMPEHATQEFLLRTIQPRIRAYEDEFNSKLLGSGDFGKRRIHVCEQALKRLDAKGQAEIDKLHLETGWSPNEIRAQYDLPSIPEGDEHYGSTNLAVLGSDKLRLAGGGRPSGQPAEPKQGEE